MTHPTSYNLEEFVRKMELPQRAKVTEGYYEPGDEDGNREFSNGEVIEVRRVVCPLVDLHYTRPTKPTGGGVGVGDEVKATVSTRTDDVRYVVATRSEALGTAKPIVYGSVKQLAESWPNMIRIANLKPSDQSPDSKSSVDSDALKGDELRLIRLIHHDQDSSSDQLEFKNLRSRQLVRLSVDRPGSFVEVQDPKTYSLRELVDMARVPRYLKIDRSSVAAPGHVQGLPPPDYRGALKMDKPQALVEIVRVLQDDSTDEEYLGSPVLVPLDCDVRLEAREDCYRPLGFETLQLGRIGDRHASRLPCVAFIVDWTEESEVLYSHVTRPGDHVVIYAVESMDKILAHTGDRYFLIPVGHPGRFTRNVVSTGGSRRVVEVDLKSLETCSFPLQVRYSTGSPEYSNDLYDHLPVDRELTFDRYVAGDRCALVSKLFGDVIGAGFHLPLLRTRISVRLGKRWKQTTKPPMMSHLDCCSEEIAGTLYNEMMTPADYEWCPAIPPRSSSARVTPWRPLQRPEPRMTSRPPPPTPPDQTANKTTKPLPLDEYESDNSSSNSSDDDAHDYSYIDVKQDVFQRRGSKDDPDDTSNMEIPSNGNISDFTTGQMVAFLRENHVSAEAIGSFKDAGFDGKTFARMTDDELTDLGMATPVIQFFRDRSRMQLVLHHL